MFEKSSPAMLARWVGRHFEANGVAADPMLCRRLVDYCGTDMYRLSSETDKLSWYTLAAGKTSASPADIERVNIADTDYDSFAFANAVMENRSADALRILAEMKRRRIEPSDRRRAFKGRDLEEAENTRIPRRALPEERGRYREAPAGARSLRRRRRRDKALAAGIYRDRAAHLRPLMRTKGR